MAMTETDGRRAAVSPHDNRPGIGNHLSLCSERKTEPRVEGVVWRPAGRALEDAVDDERCADCKAFRKSETDTRN